MEDRNHPIDEIYSSDCSIQNWSSATKLVGEKTLSFLSLNIHSLPGKFTELLAHLDSIKTEFKFIFITETYLNESTENLYNIPGYKSVSLSRSNRTGGGIKLYYKEELMLQICGEFTSNTGACERLIVSSTIPGIGNIFICGVYRPPHSSVSDFCCELEQVLTWFGDKKAVILGDFNINLRGRLSPSVSRYENLLRQFNYVNEINLLTYHSPITKTDKSCLDHIWHNLNLNRRSFILRPPLSDHYPTCLVFTRDTDDVPKTLRFRDFSENKKNSFKSKLFEEFASFHPEKNDPDMYAKQLNNFLMILYDKYFPIRTKTISYKRQRSPWITSLILKCIRKKHRWYRLMKNELITRESYVKYTKNLRELLCKAEQHYYLRKFNNLGADTKSNWKTLNSLMGKPSIQKKKTLIISWLLARKLLMRRKFATFLTSTSQVTH